MKNINRGIVLTIVLAAFMVIPATVFGDIGLPVITEQRSIRVTRLIYGQDQHIWTITLGTGGPLNSVIRQLTTTELGSRGNRCDTS